MRLSTLLVTCSLLLGTSLASPSEAQTNLEKSGAREAAQRGLAAFEAERWQEAIDDFKRAEAVIHAPTHLLYIARAHAALGQLVDARETYLQIDREQLAEDAPPAFVEAQEAARSELPELDPRVPRVTVTVVGVEPDAEGLELLYDGHSIPVSLLGVPQPIDPGKHTFEARTPNGKSEVLEVSLAEGQSQSLELKVVEGPTATGAEASEHGPGLRIAAISTLVLGAGASTVGAIFLANSGSTRGQANDLFDACEPNCSATEQADIAAFDSDADTQLAIGIAGVGVGVAALATGVTLLLIDSKKRSSSASFRVTPVVGFGWLGMNGTF